MVVADTLLIAAPIRALWRVRDRGLRFRLIAVFSAVFLMSVVSIVHTTYIMLGETFLIQGAMTAVVESGLAMFVSILYRITLNNPPRSLVCNLTVIYSALYRLAGGVQILSGPTESPNKGSGPATATIGGTGVHVQQTRRTAYDEPPTPAPPKDLDGWKNITGDDAIVVKLAVAESQASLNEMELRLAPSFNYNRPPDRSPSVNTELSLSIHKQRSQHDSPNQDYNRTPTRSPSVNTDRSASSHQQRQQLQASPVEDYIFDGSRPHWRTLDVTRTQEPVQMRVRGEEFEIYSAPQWLGYPYQTRVASGGASPASPASPATPNSSAPLTKRW